MPERARISTEQILNTIPPTTNSLVPVVFVKETGPEDDIQEVNPIIELIAAPSFHLPQMKKVRQNLTGICQPLLVKAWSQFSENTKDEKDDEAFWSIVREVFSESEEAQGVLTGITNYYSDINHIPRPASLSLGKTPNDFMAAAYFEDRSSQNYKSISIDPSVVYSFYYDGTSDELAGSALHEWVHHLLMTYKEEHNLLDPSFFINSMHTQHFVKIAQAIGINTLDIESTKNKRMRKLNSLKAEYRRYWGIIV